MLTTTQEKTALLDAIIATAPKPSNPLLGAVLYVDGSARPNPGHAGWGMQGYIYEDVQPTKGIGNPDYVLTANGYMTKVEQASMATIPLVTPVKYVDGYGALPPMSTNNAAELEGAIYAFRLAILQGVRKLRIWSDSKYVVKGVDYALKWRKNNWLKGDRTVPANVEMWKELLNLYDQLISFKVDFQIHWTEGHVGNFGNEMADEQAFIGMRHATEGLHQHDIKLSDPNGYWKYDTNRHPFINHRRMYYNTLLEHNKPGEYYIGEHDKDDDLAGKRMANGAYAVIRLQEPDPILELVRNYSCKKADGENSIMIARLDYLYRSDVHETLVNYGEVPMQLFVSNRLDTIFMDDRNEPLLVQREPPFLIQRTVNAVCELTDRMDQFLSNPGSMVTTDLTPYIYETITEKSKKLEKTFNRLRPEFKVGVSDMTANLNYHLADGRSGSMPMKLILGLDLPDRNALRRMEEKEPVITLITWPEEPQAFRYAVIIKTNDAVGIWAATYSNIMIVP